MLSNELILSIVLTYFIYFFFSKSHLEMEPTEEQMTNVEYHSSFNI